MSTFELRRGSTGLQIADPLAPEPYYRGTRFDRTGVILSLECKGHRYVSPWFLKYDPYMHDAVSGPSEEFTQIGYEEAAPGENFLKIGVGLLKRDTRPYDRFHLYEIAEGGETEVERDNSEAAFRHHLQGYYDYHKKVEIVEDGKLRISHVLHNLSDKALQCYVYCHNFFVLDGAFTGRNTCFEFPFRPEGDWRSDYDSVVLTHSGIAFSRDLLPNESVFMGNLHPAVSAGVAAGILHAGAFSSEVCNIPAAFSFRLKNNGLAVLGTCDRQPEYSVFWANHEVACIEPYLPLDLASGATARWILEYEFS